MGPMRLAPVYVEMVWGGDALRRRFGKNIPSGRTGESWEASVHPKGLSLIENGPFAGRTLAEAVAQAPEAMLGSAMDAEGGFPLLIKLISAEDALSIQVHPSDEMGAPLKGQGKTEAWMIIAAQDGAELVYGLRKGVTRDEFARAMDGGAAVEALMRRVKVKAGNVFFIPAGLVHAIGKGILLYEVQQNSDTTYRIYDWGRTGLDGKPRALHKREALCVVDLAARGAQPVGFTRAAHGGERTTFIVCPHFALETLRVDGCMTVATNGRFAVLTALRGEGRVLCGGEAVSAKAGDTVLIPGGEDAYTLEGNMAWIVSHVPDEDALRAALRAAGWKGGCDVAGAGILR